MARLYTLKGIAFAAVAAFLGTLPVAILLGLLVKWDYWVSLLWALAPALGATIGGTFPTYRAYSNLLDPTYEGSSRVDQVRHITLYLPYHAAFQLCLDSLVLFNSYRVLVANPTQGRIEAAIVPEPFWKSLFNGSGLRISFRLGSDQEGMTYVIVASKASLGTTRIDFGFNKKNVSRILAFFESRGVRSDWQGDTGKL
jgi:hypothetical protein